MLDDIDIKILSVVQKNAGLPFLKFPREWVCLLLLVGTE